MSVTPGSPDRMYKMCGNRDVQTEDGDASLRKLFTSIDINGDGRISNSELYNKIKTDGSSLPICLIDKVHERADLNGDGELDYGEFVYMVRDSRNRNLFRRYLNTYVHQVVPEENTDGQFESEYSCWPPVLGMIFISIFIVIIFALDASNGSINATGPIAQELMFDPRKKAQFWRYLTYMFVHNGYVHLCANVLLQILLGIPLEMVHQWWRVLIVYILGVVTGSLGSAMVDGTAIVVGASGGVYALITAHLAAVIMNWKQMTNPLVQTIVLSVVIIYDVTSAIQSRYGHKESQNVSYAAHFFGATTGLLVGIIILRNLQVYKVEKILMKIAVFVYIILVIVAIIWNIVQG